MKRNKRLRDDKFIGTLIILHFAYLQTRPFLLNVCEHRDPSRQKGYTYNKKVNALGTRTYVCMNPEEVVKSLSLHIVS